MTGEAKNKLYIKTVQFINVQKKNATARIGYFLWWIALRDASCAHHERTA